MLYLLYPEVILSKRSEKERGRTMDNKCHITEAAYCKGLQRPVAFVTTRMVVWVFLLCCLLALRLLLVVIDAMYVCASMCVCVCAALLSLSLSWFFFSNFPPSLHSPPILK